MFQFSSFKLLKAILIAIVWIVIFAITNSSGEVTLMKGAPHVKTGNGVYVGKVKQSRDEQSYHEFLGIRYARVPKRFQVIYSLKMCVLKMRDKHMILIAGRTICGRT